MSEAPGLEFCVALSFSPLDQFVPLAKAADESGWHAVALSDHVVNPEVIASPYPYTEDGSRRWEPFTPWADPLGVDRRHGGVDDEPALLHERVRAADAPAVRRWPRRSARPR